MVNIFEDKPKFRPMYKHELQEMKHELERVRRTATMEHSSFENITSSATHVIPEGEVNDFVRDRTRLWRQTWLVHPLDEMIERVDDCLNGVSAAERERRNWERKYGR